MKNVFNLEQTKSKKIILPVLIFTFFFFIFLSSNGGHTDPVDGFIYFIMAENFVKNGSLTLNVNSPTALDFDFDVERKIRGKTSSMAALEYDKNPDPDLTRNEYVKLAIENTNREEFIGPFYVVLPMVAAPLYVIAEHFGFYPYTFVSLFLNSIVIALICVVMFFFGKSVFGSAKIGFVLALIFGVTSFIWPYNSSMFSRPLAILFLMSSVYMIYNKNTESIITPFLSALFIGLSVLTHTLFLLYSPGLVIFGIFSFKEDKKKIISFIVGIIIITAIIGSINYIRFESVMDFGLGSIQEGSFLTSSTEGLYAFLISSGQSIFLYFPIAFLFPLGIYCLYKKNKSLTAIIVYLFLVTYLYIGFSSNWDTSMTWGPHRYLLPIIPLIVISIGSLMTNLSTKMRRIIISLSVVGFIVNVTASLVWYRFAMAFSRGVANEFGWLENYQNVRVWEPIMSPILMNFGVLAIDYVGTRTVNPNLTADFFQFVIPGCSFDVYVYCQFGIIPIILLGILITVIGIAILYVLGIIGNKNTFKSKSNQIKKFKVDT